MAGFEIKRKPYKNLPSVESERKFSQKRGEVKPNLN